MEIHDKMVSPGRTDERTEATSGRGAKMGARPGEAPYTLESGVLSVALIGADEGRRRPIAAALAGLQGSVTREFSAYPEIDDLPRLMRDQYDVIIVDLDGNPEHALDLVENICGNSAATVMVYSSEVSPEMLVRCMRAGAREFLSQPFTPTSMAEALIRASDRRPVSSVPKRALGKVLVFVGAKGGSGVTTIASNFAISLAKESGQGTVLIDLNPLGDAALELGVSTQYSTANALENSDKLDSNFLSTLLVEHSSGLSILAAPDKYTEIQPTRASVEKLLSVVRGDFDYVVVDAGTRFGPNLKTLFDESSAIFFVVQVGITDLRNANRLICNLFRSNESKLQVVLNRFTPNVMGLDDARITKALTVPVSWRIPNDYPTARDAQTSATPLVLEDSPISRIIKQMSRVACGLPAVPETKKRFLLFG
jgi:pilus assembly protein CpaE